MNGKRKVRKSKGDIVKNCCLLINRERRKNVKMKKRNVKRKKRNVKRKENDL